MRTQGEDEECNDTVVHPHVHSYLTASSFVLSVYCHAFKSVATGKRV